MPECFTVLEGVTMPPLQIKAGPALKYASGLEIEFKAEGNVIETVETELKRDERVLRFLTVKLDKHAVAYNEKKRRKAQEAKEAQAN
jgi:small subunit ribosomal protein S6